MDKENKLIKFLNGKGFYVVMGICLLAVGVAAWIAIAGIPDVEDIPQTNISSTATEENLSSEKQAAAEASDIPAEEKHETASKEEVSSEAKKVEAAFFTLPVTGEIIKGYSESELLYSKTYNDMRIHLGLDIAADIGTAVKASGDGKIIDIKKDNLLGTVVEIDHGNNIVGIYAGLNEKTAVKKGDIVKAGTTIGAVGTVPSESADSAHLHLEFKENGKNIAPLSLINLGSSN